MSDRHHIYRLRRRYGTAPDQVGDLHVSAADPERGTIVLIHGGFWRSHRDLTMTRPAAGALAGLGWNVWNIEYRRGADAKWHDTLCDVDAAISHLRVLAEELGIDTSTVLLVGHSAGGHLAAWAASTGIEADGLVTLNGVVDLGLAAELGLGDGAVEEFLGGSPGALEVADPSCRLPLAVPARLLHSQADERVPVTVAHEFHRHAIEANSDVELVEISGRHTEPIEVGSAAWEQFVTAVSRPWPGRIA